MHLSRFERDLLRISIPILHVPSPQNSQGPQLTGFPHSMYQPLLFLAKNGQIEDASCQFLCTTISTAHMSNDSGLLCKGRIWRTNMINAVLHSSGRSIIWLVVDGCCGKRRLRMRGHKKSLTDVSRSAPATHSNAFLLSGSRTRRQSMRRQLYKYNWNFMLMFQNAPLKLHCTNLLTY